MPSAPLHFRAICGGFYSVFLSFMLNRAKLKAAMFCRVLTLRSRADGVMAGVLLFLLYMGNLIHQCGDIELNPGPPKQDPSSFRQTRLTSGGQRRDSGSKGPGPGEKLSEDPTIKDVVSMLTDLSEQFHGMRNDIAELKQSHADLKNELRDMWGVIDSLKTENGCLRNENDELKTKVDDLERKVDDLEGRSKRNNLIIHGIPRGEKETWQDCEELVGEMITDKLEMSEAVKFDRVHRLNASPSSPIVARCTFFKDKDKMLRERSKLKGTGIYINEDFSFRVREIRKKLIPHLKTAREQGKKVTMVFDHLVVEGKKYFLDGDDKLKEST